MVSNHIAASSRKNLYNFYDNAAIFVDQVLEFHLFDRNKKTPSALCGDQGLKGIENQADKTTCLNDYLESTICRAWLISSFPELS